MKKIVFILFIVLAAKTNAQYAKVYPSNWWTGMKNPKLQLLLHAGFDIADEIMHISYPGIAVDKITPFANKHYIAIDLTISPQTKPGTMYIECKKNKKVNRIPFELMQRHVQNGKTRVQSVTAKDLVYLIMPDRFANGDSSNDVVKAMRDSISNRNNMYARHGGDLKGIRDHLDYFTEWGVTALWLTPVIENDMPLTEEARTVAPARFAERTNGFSRAKNILTGDTIQFEIFSIPASTTWVLELKK
ncbi:cyclomaltodextrinase N-terminal domain-containing protein [Agriterribacter sp.]|uniref:cyclomaltodextrinase N-terminal domain-containing protein n=1 Tax=Agriterribacter sp. TaxID=2821509 RepID=UPI002D19063F|nr:cyclomaltodextrinase N-terminal domain-containing protein [Agriterribacter sp.]HRP55161.1 cyclomaltodextrinase N-terminal domain-containing protein [Agriterribacter sp.]